MTDTAFGPSAIATPANYVTIARLLLSPLLFVAIADGGSGWPIFAVWTALCLTDGVDGDQVVGVLSERDLVRAIARDGRDSLDRTVSDYMTGDVVFAAPTETIDILMARMTDRRIRHLPVLREKRLSGVVSIGDVVKCKIAEATNEAETLKAYIVSG